MNQEAMNHGQSPMSPDKRAVVRYTFDGQPISDTHARSLMISACGCQNVRKFTMYEMLKKHAQGDEKHEPNKMAVELLKHLKREEKGGEE